MLSPDFINGSFEIIGACVLWLNVKQIRKDKELKGYNPSTTAFFMLWGMWNLFYYPHLDQWLSFIGGLAIMSVNVIWLGHIIYYKSNRYKNATS